MIFIVQFVSNNLERQVCKALTKCATFCSVKSFKKKSIDFYNIDIVYLLNSIFTKKYLQVHMPLCLTIYDRSVAEPTEKNYKTKIIC